MHEEVGESAGWGWGQPFGPRLEGGEGRSRDTAALQVSLLRVKLGQVIAETQHVPFVLIVTCTHAQLSIQASKPTKVNNWLVYGAIHG